MTEREQAAARRRRTAAAEPAESVSKQQTSVENTAANPTYTWSQTADEVVFEMPVRLQTERRGLCAPCVVRKGGGETVG